MAKAQQASAKTVAKKRIVKVDTHGDVHINATFNNIIISITNNFVNNIIVAGIHINNFQCLPDHILY